MTKQPTMARTFLIAAGAAVVSWLGLAVLAPLAGAAGASTNRGTFEITGGGFGHGIGMSQYGAMGYALHGWDYPAILEHYYQGTSLGRVANSEVSVLLQDGAVAFTGASSANGRSLTASRTYGVVVSGTKLALISGGRPVGTFTAPLQVGGSALDVVGKGRYAGSLTFYPAASGGVLTVNTVDLEDYVRGVIAEEMPASWPEQALEAQAVAARTYVLADTPVSSEYDVYADTRSQVYGGLAAETPATDLAESATRGQVVEDAGKLIPTYFFSSSGGHTEDIQNVWLSISPAAYLVGVPDPYDDSGQNPYYRWSDRLSLATAAHRLAGLYRGSFEGIRVLRHGVSPRIVAASVIGSRGDSTVSGVQLQTDLGTYSTWMTFTTVTAQGTSASGDGSASGSGSASRPAGSTSAASNSPTTTTSTTTPSSGGAGLSGGGQGIGDLARAPRRAVSGRVFPVTPGAWVRIERHSAAGGWVTVARARVAGDGLYTRSVFAPGVYRAVYHGVAAPATTVR